MSAYNTIPGFDHQQSDMYVLDLNRKFPAGEVLGILQRNSGVKDVYLGIICVGYNEEEEAVYLHTEPRRCGLLPEGIEIAIMYDKGERTNHLDTECKRFKVAGRVITPKLIELVKKELSE